MYKGVDFITVKAFYLATSCFSKRIITCSYRVIGTFRRFVFQNSGAFVSNTINNVSGIEGYISFTLFSPYFHVLYEEFNCQV